MTFSSGSLPRVSFEALAEHLEHCLACQSNLQALPEDTDPWLAAFRAQTITDPFADEPQCRDAVARFQETISQAAVRETRSAPERLGSYELLQPLGEGGMGVVYKARHIHLNKVVALKLLPSERLSNPQAVARFQREMVAAGALTDGHIVAALDAGESEGRHYLAMEFVEGLNLGEVVRRYGPLSVADACEVVRQAALGLQHAHERGLTHRDIKPSNLMLARGGQVKVLDLGLARFLSADRQSGSDVTATGQVVGTVDYIAPEQVENPRSADIRADVYSLGCTLYFLLAGRSPFSGPAYASVHKKLMAHAREPIPPLREQRPKLPQGLVRVVERMVAKQPAARFATPQEVAEAVAPLATGADLAALLRFVEGRKETAPREPAAPRRTRPRRHWRTAALAASIVLAALATLVVLGRSRPERQPGVAAPAAERPTAALQVLPLRVEHFASRGEKVEARGDIGVRSYTARYGDQVRVTAELSEPAYFFLLALNADGKVQRCWPADDEMPPPLLKRLDYPVAGKAFNLDDEERGGMQAFVVVASRQPLPAYAAWRQGRPTLPWQRLPAVPGVVWRGDGERLEPMLASDDQRGTVTELKGVEPLAEVARRLHRAEGVEAVEVLAFPTAAKAGQ
jgi:hypothetical protein